MQGLFSLACSLLLYSVVHMFAAAAFSAALLMLFLWFLRSTTLMNSWSLVILLAIIYTDWFCRCRLATFSETLFAAMLALLLSLAAFVGGLLMDDLLSCE